MAKPNYFSKLTPFTNMARSSKNKQKPLDSRPLKMLQPIFNPYDKNNYVGNFSIDKMFTAIKPVPAIKNRLMRSDGLFGDHWGSATTDTIYIYKISGNTAVLQIDIPFAYKSDKYRDEYIAVGYYDKSLKNHLDAWERNKEKAIKEEYKTQYEMWHFGAIKRKDMMSKKDWVVVPREIFSNINDEVYLCICTEARQGEPVVKCAKFPTSRPFFYDLPVATSVHEGQHLKDSSIVLGRVMEFSIKSSSHYTKCQGEYVWNDPEQPLVNDSDKAVECRKTKEYTFVQDTKRVYTCPEIDLFIYKKSPSDREKEVSAFVWQSGNEDDEVKKEYISDGSESPYNTYPNILDCLSTHTMYRSMVSLTKFTAENAARYVVRALAKQPAGNRCISIDGNNLVFLMGGAIFKIESIIVQVIKEALAQERQAKKEGRELTEEEKRKFTDDELSTIEDLYAINNSHLFFDTAISYKKRPHEAARHYMQDVLGIEEGSSGCIRIQKLLTDLFAQISKLGIILDYVYCDIEGPWNNARVMLSRRFNERYFNQISTTNTDFYNTTVLEELKARKEIWNEMLKRGLDLSVKHLWDTCLANDNVISRLSFYGLNPETYAVRRNPNIWDAVMKGYENDLFYKYVFTPVLKYHPKAKCSVFAHDNAKGYVNRAQRFETYLGGSVLQNPDIYSCGAIYGEVPGEYYKKLCMDNWTMYPNKRNYYSYFVGNINMLRSVLVSTQSEKQRNGKFNVFISSFNIWVNGYLYSDIDGETEQLVMKLENDEEFRNSLKAYYNEFLYHVFLCCPDKANAYFQVEQRAISDNGTTDNGGTYYFPYGNGKDFESYKKYYTNCYETLQNALKELNDILKGEACETTVSTLASENEPYVLSGVKLKDRTLWRITLNEPITNYNINENGNNIDINLSNGRSISFTKLKGSVFNKNIGGFGQWIETSLSDEPKFDAEDNYYENNPAYSSQIDYDKLTSEVFANECDETNLKGIAVIGTSLRLLKPKTNTIFGETPKFFTTSTKFKMNHENGDGYVLLNYLSGDNFLFTIGKVNKNCGALTASTKKGKQLSIKGQLALGVDYELIRYTALKGEISDNAWVGTTRFELWKLSSNKTRQTLVFDDEYDFYIDNSHHDQCFINGFDILQKSTEFSWDSINVKEFKMYFTQQHEKLELFRESDGVNIGRVNKQVATYANLPVETKQSDTLIGKLSWLNATNRGVRYDISFSTYNGNRKLQSFENIASFTVGANSEGHKLITLPPLMKGVTRVTLEYKKQGSLDYSVQQIEFFKNYFNENSHKVISVDIVP